MYRYARSDFDRVLEFLRGAYEPRDPDRFIDYLLAAIPILVPVSGVASGWIPIQGNTQPGSSRGNPSELGSPELDSAIARYSSEHAMMAHYQRTRTEQFTRWSDLQPFSEFRRTALYEEVYRQWGIQDSCGLAFSSTPDRLDGVGAMLDKHIPDSTRDILVSISPHLIQAYRTAHKTSAIAEMAAMKTGPHRMDRGIVAMDLDGTITFETAGATILLGDYFEPRTGQRLPDKLARWVSSCDQSLREATDVPAVRHPLVISRAGRRLTIHLLSKPEQNFLVLEQYRWMLDADAAGDLPLTKRESEVLAYVAGGKTNPEIAIILGVSARTVSKHVEHILERLGVETRTAAAAVALAAINA